MKAACGYKHSILLTEDQKILSLGLNVYGQCGQSYITSPEVRRISEIYLPLLDK